MDAPIKVGRRITTGLFEIDLSTGEVLRQGRRLPVQEQPFRVLALLLEHPGQVVSREKLQASLWPADTYVSFDEGLNTAIRKLRVLFGDSADNPRFIETIPRRGYRFIAPVTELPAKNGSATPPAASLNGKPQGAFLPEVISAPQQTNTHTPTSAVSSRPRRRVRIWTLSLAAPALLLLLLAVWYFRPETLTVIGKVRLTDDGKAKIPFLAPATDGLHLYFVEGQPYNSGSGIAQMSATGGETTWIPTSLRGILAIPSISRDGSKLLVITSPSEGSGAAGFWIQPLPAGAPFRVGHLTGGSACFTPDGMHILYQDVERVVRVVNLDGSDPHTLTTVPGGIRAPRYSPDGKRIRFTMLQPEGSGLSIWEMEADGSHLHPLFPNWEEAPVQSYGSWSPDGAYYYFQAGRGDDQAIWVLPERRSIFRRAPAPFRLISEPLRFGGPSPSLDGNKLFVVSDEARVELFRYDLKAKRFDPYLGGLSAGPVNFSPDGKSIAYVSYPDMTLWRSRLDLSEKMQLTFPPVRAYEPRWSPDGSRIAFADVQPNRPWSIRVLDAAGGDTARPIEAQKVDDAETDPTWTPDGKSIVFSKSAAAGTGVRAIYRVNLDNGNLTQVPGSDQVYSPRLSPDGQFISALKTNGKDLMLFDLKTNQWSTLGLGELLAFNEWSRDGKYVYWRAIRGGSGHLMRIEVRDRRMEDVLDLKDFLALVDDFANWLGLTPDGGVLLMRDRSVQEIYALTLEKK